MDSPTTKKVDKRRNELALLTVLGSRMGEHADFVAIMVECEAGAERSSRVPAEIPKASPRHIALILLEVVLTPHLGNYFHHRNTRRTSTTIAFPTFSSCQSRAMPSEKAMQLLLPMFAQLYHCLSSASNQGWTRPCTEKGEGLQENL